MKKQGKTSITGYKGCLIKKLYRTISNRIFPQSLSIQKKIFMLCTLVMLISTVILSSVFLYMTIQKIRQNSRLQIETSLDFILNDINNKSSDLSRNLENLVLYEHPLRNLILQYNSDHTIISNQTAISNYVLPAFQEIYKFAKSNGISTLRLYTPDKRLLFYYSAFVPEREVTGLYLKTITGNDTFNDTKHLSSIDVTEYFLIPYYPAPKGIDAFYERPQPTRRESRLHIKDNNITIRVIEPFTVFKEKNGFIIAEYHISDNDAYFYKKFTGTDISFFTNDYLSCGTLNRALLPSDVKHYDTIVSTKSGLLRTKKNLQLSELKINNHIYYQGHARFYEDTNKYVTITASLKKNTELIEITKTIIIVIASAVAVMLITFSLSIFFTKPYLLFIHNMIKSVSAVAAGNLDQKIPVHTKDELGILAVSFKNMKDSIQQIIGEQKRLVNILETTSDMICM